MNRREQEQFRHQTVVGRGGFEVDAVLEYLHGDLSFEIRVRAAQPTVGFGSAEERSGQHQRSAVGREVITVDIGTLDVTRDELPMLVQAAEKPLPEVRIGPGAAAGEHAEQPYPGENPHRWFHRQRPVDSLTHRICTQPLLEDTAGAGGEALLGRDEVGLSDRQQPL